MTVRTRIAGTRIHAHTAYRPVNTHASGRPSDASTSIANASFGRLQRWQSIAARHSVTIIGSELAISTRCEYVSSPSRPMPATAPAANGAYGLRGHGPVIM